MTRTIHIDTTSEPGAYKRAGLDHPRFYAAPASVTQAQPARDATADSRGGGSDFHDSEIANG